LSVLAFSMVMILLGALGKIEQTYTIYFSSLISNIIGLYVQFPQKNPQTNTDGTQTLSSSESFIDDRPLPTPPSLISIPRSNRSSRHKKHRLHKRHISTSSSTNAMSTSTSQY
jgi:hypothetical protein